MTNELPEKLAQSPIPRTFFNVFSQINRIYDDLLQNQVVLDPEAKRALYTDLWDLYA